MSTTTRLAFRLRHGWTLRQVAATMVQEWLPPFRAEPAAKAARWVLQSIMESNDKSQAPLWEAGISTDDYEKRLDAADLTWAIRATAGRSKGIILARFTGLDKDQHSDTFELTSYLDALPDALFDAEKVKEFLESQGLQGQDGLFAALLASNGFQTANS